MMAVEVAGVAAFDFFGGLAIIAASIAALLIARPWRPDPADYDQKEDR